MFPTYQNKLQSLCTREKQSLRNSSEELTDELHVHLYNDAGHGRFGHVRKILLKSWGHTLFFICNKQTGQTIC